MDSATMRRIALEAAQTANDRAGEALSPNYPATMALVSIAYSLASLTESEVEAAQAQAARLEAIELAGRPS